MSARLRISMTDEKWGRETRRRLMQEVGDPRHARIVIEQCDADPGLKQSLSYAYYAAQKTIQQQAN